MTDHNVRVHRRGFLKMKPGLVRLECMEQNLPMETLAARFDQIEGPDDKARDLAYVDLLNRTDTSADLYAQWSRFAAMLSHPDNHLRSIGGQLFAHFASSDPEGRVWGLWEQWKAVATDKMFVTARHTLQASPRFALAGAKHRTQILDYYVQRFRTCVAEKNTTLIRFDLQVCLRAVYDQKPNAEVAALARGLIAEETDPKYQTKYATAWKKVPL